MWVEPHRPPGYLLGPEPPPLAREAWRREGALGGRWRGGRNPVWLARQGKALRAFGVSGTVVEHLQTQDLLAECFAGFKRLEATDYDAEIRAGTGYAGLSVLINSPAAVPPRGSATPATSTPGGTAQAGVTRPQARGDVAGTASYGRAEFGGAMLRSARCSIFPVADLPAWLRRLTAALLLAPVAALATAPAAAHPHVFIDTGLEIVFDDEGRVAAVQVVWVHDAFYTMLALDEYGMDPEFTGTVTEAERAELAAIYSNWDEGYAGDLYALLDGEPLPLSGPRAMWADVEEDRLILAHRRAVLDPQHLDGRKLVLQVYDPTYFIAYTVAVEPTVSGRDDCVATVYGPDWEAANARLIEALDELAAQGLDEWEIEADFPAVGAEFAEEVRLTCAAR